MCLHCTNRHVDVSEGERERGGEERERERQTGWLEGMLGYAGVRTLFPSSPKPYFLLLSANRTVEKSGASKSSLMHYPTRDHITVAT